MSAKLYNVTASTKQDGNLSINACAGGKKEAADFTLARLEESGYHGSTVTNVRHIGTQGAYSYGSTLIIGEAK